MKEIKVTINGQTYALQADDIHHPSAITYKGKRYNVTTARQNPSLRVLVNAEEFEVKVSRKDAYSFSAEVDGKKHTVSLDTESGRGARNRKQVAHVKRSERHEVTAPLPGKIVQVMIKAGDSVHVKQVMLSLEAMKMQNEILSPADGIVKEVKVAKGANVSTGDVMVVVEEK